MLKGLPETNKRIRQDFKLDLEWWRSYATFFNDTTMVIKGEGPWVYTDTSLNGYGLWSNKDWQAGYFNTSVKPKGRVEETTSTG